MIIFLKKTLDYKEVTATQPRKLFKMSVKQESYKVCQTTIGSKSQENRPKRRTAIFICEIRISSEAKRANWFHM